MALYCYIKAVPRVKTKRIGYWRFLPLGLVTMGLVLLFNAALPILFYQLKSNRFNRQLIVPLPDFSLEEQKSKPIKVLGADANEVDYTQVRNWFPAAPELPPQPSKITHYNLSIPKLGIERAVVEIGGEDLFQSLIHYPGTALPGQYGNAVIFGHSVLPQFFNPKNYKTIFSTLPTLKKGDEILIDFDGLVYRYRVTRMIEVPPEDVSVLEQHYDDEYLTLVTCVPPGTYLRRLIVRARLVHINY